MNKNIIHKINALGANTDAVNISENFAENWKNIRFNNHLYHKDWQLYGIDEFLLCVLQILISRTQQFTAQTMKYISRKLKAKENWRISWTDS
ncbi:Uncharacterised protein [Chryseobacterium gleum]|uniref:Uncharacterized protein n=1 Tax=Chryseobacterium gleum TaxID=250 RepID=A0A3S4N1P6_CHRGE|nr:hypothetical protein [Chryseobacterium gleum]QQY30416.1 hypothetical protein I6I60_16250 [Chryseobacterium gleum]VEE05257.1 Uncharacterised protein [Chryseobacterium gleum]